jgi:hypothetical protein
MVLHKGRSRVISPYSSGTERRAGGCSGVIGQMGRLDMIHWLLCEIRRLQRKNNLFLTAASKGGWTARPAEGNGFGLAMLRITVVELVQQLQPASKPILAGLFSGSNFVVCSAKT